MTVTSEESFISLEKLNATSPAGFRCTRNYTGDDEKDFWWYIKRWSKDQKSVSFSQPHTFSHRKQDFRTRRSYWHPQRRPALRIRINNSDEIGAFIKLTNLYCLLCCDQDSHNLLSTMKGDLQKIPIINTTLAGCRTVGRMCVGNKNGLLLPDTVYDTEVKEIKNQLPESVKVEKVEETLSALGNVIVCNDNIALVHPDIGKETEELIADTLGVEVFRHMIANNPLVGSYCVLNNCGGLVLPGIVNSELENLSSLLQLPLAVGTVNYGCKVLAAGLVASDHIIYAGMKTTSHEFSIIEKILSPD